MIAFRSTRLPGSQARGKMRRGDRYFDISLRFAMSACTAKGQSGDCSLAAVQLVPRAVSGRPVNQVQSS